MRKGCFVHAWIKFDAVRSIAIFSCAFIGWGLGPQTPSVSSSQAASDAIAPGTLLQVEISKDIDAKKAHPGDVFRTKLWTDVRSGDKVILPKKTVIMGHVVATQPRTKGNPESKLSIAFDKAMLKDGSELPLHGVLERVELSPMAVAASNKDKEQLYSANPGSTTNIAMPAQLPEAGQGGSDSEVSATGPTNVRDPNIGLQQDSLRGVTILSSSKEDVKLKHFATIDVLVTH
jgi:hypothetical protein